MEGGKYIAEFLGTAVFLMAIKKSGEGLTVAAALLVAMAIFGGVSGGNFNPAVTVMQVVDGKLAQSDMVPYILAQVAGGLAALTVLKNLKR